MENKKKSALVVVLVLAIIGAYGWTRISENERQSQQTGNETRTAEMEKVRVQASWILNGEFSNVCSAIVHGYYKEEGLDVEMVPGGPSGASFIVATNAIAQDPDLTLGIDGDLVPLLRGVTKENENEKLRVKAFASFWNENPYGFIVRKDSGITSLKDFVKTKSNGEKYKIGVTADSVIQYAIADYADVDVSELNLVTVGFDATPLLTGQVDALAAYWTTQAYEVEKAGIEYNFLGVDEMPGYSQPSMIAMATDKMLKEKPEVLEKWLRATIKGSEYIKQNPEKAAEDVRDARCGGSKLDKEQEEWLIKKSLPLLSESRVGWMDKEQIMNYAKAYYDLKQIPRVPDAEEIMDYSILNKIYND